MRELEVTEKQMLIYTLEREKAEEGVLDAFDRVDKDGRDLEGLEVIKGLDEA